MEPIDKIVDILAARNRSDLAHILRGSYYELSVSSTYGSRLYSRLTTVIIELPFDKYERLQELSAKDRAEIIRAFQVIYPVRNNEVEIDDLEFAVDPNIPFAPLARQATRLNDIDFGYIIEQIDKCDKKILSSDYDGAITNARTLVESICKYILDAVKEQYDEKTELPILFNKTAQILNMHPSQHAEKAFKQILSGCFSIVNGLAAIRNELSDSHGKSKTKQYRADKRHAVFVVGSAKALSDFIYSSFIENKSDNNENIIPKNT